VTPLAVTVAIAAAFIAGFVLAVIIFKTAASAKDR
jgi:hypothetical protein